VITGKYMKGYKKGRAAVDKKTLPCTAATQIFPKCTAAKYTAASCTGTATANILNPAKVADTCTSKLATCAGTLKSTCAAGCTFKAATYTGDEKYDVPAVTKEEAVKGVETACTAADVSILNPTCISTPACTGTATKKGHNKGTTADLPAAAGTDVTVCAATFAARVGSAKSDCDAGCDYVAVKPGAYTGTSTQVKTAAVTAVAAYTPMCSTSCTDAKFRTKIQTTKNDQVGCAPGCAITAAVPVVPAVAPSPAKSSSASAATMAAATIALSAIAAIVAL